MKNAAILQAALLAMLGAAPAIHAQPASVDVPNAPVPIQVLAQSPADTITNLQVICLFRSSPVNILHGSLAEIDEKLNGLLTRVRNTELFRGEPGETLLLTPPDASLRARKLLIVGLGDSQTFTPERMQLVGEIVYSEASRLGVAHPFFAPTILDGGVAKFTTGQVAEQVIAGFLRGLATQKVLKDAKASGVGGVSAFTYLAGAKNVDSTREGIEKALAAVKSR